MTMQQAFMAQNQQQTPTLNINLRNPRHEIPIQYTNQGPPPGAPPGGGRILRSYGPARLPRERMAPFQGQAPPPAPGGATSPMPVQERPTISRKTVPTRREYFPRRRRPDMPDPPIQQEEPKKVKRKAPQQAVPVSLKPYRVPRGPGHQLPDEPPSFVPFSGRAQRLPEDQGGNLRANAIQRMRELGHQGEQRRRGREMVDRMGDLGRAIRRGGARGDVVPLGKRKRDAEIFAPNTRQRIGDRPVGPQQFSIAT